MPTIALRGRGWTVEYVDDVRATAIEHGHDENDELDGLCLLQERLILVDSELDGQARLETELHELIHAYEPALHENYVRPAARQLARALWRLGWRAAPLVAKA